MAHETPDKGSKTRTDGEAPKEGHRSDIGEVPQYAAAYDQSKLSNDVIWAAWASEEKYHDLLQRQTPQEKYENYQRPEDPPRYASGTL